MKHRCMVVVRVRGVISASRRVRETLQMLRLTKNNYAILLEKIPSLLGMLNTAKDYITWGEASQELVETLIRERGRLAGKKRLTDEYAKKNGYATLAELTKAVYEGHIEYRKLSNIQPVFKLHPPSKGFRGKIKKDYGSGGELGYRGVKINDLIPRMI